MKFTKFFLVVAFIFAVVGSSVAAPVVGAVANKAAQKAAGEGAKKFTNKQIAGGIIAAGGVAGTGAWALNRECKSSLFHIIP
ncbi:hypothetical protein BKA69DRAFT_1129043 [Paraphysoderma sedebokerense]|nr:hypothetical protein BKA69DRAFT_1129043 [Paraphysoderma sedebokerense]